MDPNPGYLFDSMVHPSMRFDSTNGKGAINLGLSLSTMQVDSGYIAPTDEHHVQGFKLGGEEYDDGDNDEGEGVQSRQRWIYVKVNMDGLIIGRKICVFEQSNYSTLALQLDDMFGGQCASNDGLNLFEDGSEFSLIYKDHEENWRVVGDVPWNEFVKMVKRIRIARKDQAASTLLAVYSLNY